MRPTIILGPRPPTASMRREADDDMNRTYASIGDGSHGLSVRLTRQTVTIPEAAAILGIPRSTAYELAKKGVIPTLRLGRRKLVSRAVLHRMLGSDHTEGCQCPKTMNPDHATDSRAAAA